MSSGRTYGDPGVALVPGELRGFRQFELRPDGLYPLAKSGFGPWHGEGERARCARNGAHPPPGADCTCGLYAWYLPGSATVSLGPASAVVAARGRCVLGDRGFRAAQARIEAVSLPVWVRWNPRAAERARRMLGERYPDARLYRSTRAMLRDHPPAEVGALGIEPPPDPSRRYRAAVAGMFALSALLVLALATLPGRVAEEGATRWSVLLVLAVLAWQGSMVWLVSRLLALQGAGGAAHPHAG